MTIFRHVLISMIVCMVFATEYNFAQDVPTQIERYQEEVRKSKEQGDQQALAANLNKLAYLYWQINALKDASDYFKQSLEINKQIGNTNAVRIINGNLGLIFSELENYLESINYFEESLKLNQSAGKKSEIVSDFLNIAMAMHELGYYAESNNKATKALEIALELEDLSMSKTCYGLLAENYEKLGDNKQAGEYYEKYNTISKHLQKVEMEELESQSREFEAQVVRKEKELKSTLDTLGDILEVNREMQLQNELLNKENLLREMEIAQNEAREKARKKQISMLLGVLALFLLIMILFFIQVQQKKRANATLKKQNIEIENQKVEIEKQHELSTRQQKKITDSIQYARRIQSAVIPPLEILQQNMKDCFVLYQPRDIVSGDFYWISQKDELLIVAAADCTGHGVPGAFMSMLGIAFLNEIVNKIAVNKHITTMNPDEILNQLREMVIASLHQTGNPNEPKDGMDIALCVVDFSNKKLQFAGANNPLLLIRDGELIQHKGDRMPVSYHQKVNVPFTSHEIDLKAKDCLYMFSDGYTDQFGGPANMKFMSKRFRELLVEIHDRPMTEQKQILQQTMDEWRGDKQQLDDILVLGMRFAAVPAKTTATQTWPDKTILIAEDTDVNYFLLAEVLKKTKANLVRVKDGREAVDFIHTNEVDLVLMDINMPNMNGYDATREIKKNRKDIPVIVQTALDMLDEEEQSLEAGADDFISKPIDLKTFMKKIGKFLNQ